ncbi:plastocyanin/azurin family copper-binding protein [Salinigranum marinum]|uniref:plastocyanin/azurin family copper-binding protein n=1 Tax=Salinigranum marinum TaxID=1515595 RepID=UPI00298A0598|nr:plastocyanin/azurin family copper-binding protein [Salinigranum marinum]
MTDDPRPTTRRTALKRLAAATTVASLAGCAGGSGGPETADGGGGDATATPTATSADTATATATPTEPDTQAATSTVETATTTTERGAYTVDMYTELYFDPVGLFVEPGETVSFELVSGAHSATAYHPDNPNALNRRIPDGAPAWDTETFGDVGTFRNVTFETEGTHDYYCIPHKMVGMVGRIVVGSPGGPAEESENPDLPLPDSARIVEEGEIAWADWQENV